MTTSNTFAFSPSLGDFVTGAFARCGVRRTDLTAQHMEDARFESNILMADWTSNGINLWQVNSGSMLLTQGTTDYDLPDNIVFLLDVYITTGSNPPTNRLIFPISRSDYAAIANPTTQGFPTSYWYDRLINTNINIWPTADSDNTYTLSYYYMRQAQDSELSNGTQMELPWMFYGTFVSCLAARLAAIYAPERAIALDGIAQRDWAKALAVGTENTSMKIMPNFQSYYR